MEAIVLEVEKRSTLGKKVKALRRSGLTPANIFGHDVASQAIQVKTADAEKALAKAGTHHIITLKGSAFKAGRKVLTKGVQRNYMTGELIHLDFHQVSLKEKIKVEVPLAFQGKAPAAGRKDLLVFEVMRSIEVECLPDAIPERIEADLSQLAEAGDHILVKNLKLPEKVSVLTHSDEVVARVGFAKAIEVEKETAEGAVAETAVAGEKPKAEGEAKAA